MSRRPSISIRDPWERIAALEQALAESLESARAARQSERIALARVDSLEQATRTAWRLVADGSRPALSTETKRES